jgi:hypothetical protein
MRHLSAAWRGLRDVLGRDVVINAVENAGNPDWIPGCTVSVDAVAYIPKT